MRDIPYEANRRLSLLSKMFNLAELWGLRPDGSNPCRHVKHYPERKRDRFLTPDELGRVGQVLAEFEEGDFLDRNYAAAIRLLALTGCRFGEILSLQWKWVNILAGTLDLPDAKAGGRRVPLGAAALELLLSLQTAAAGPWVVAGASADQPMNKPSLEHAWVRIRKSARIEDVRLHDFRHTVGTYSGQAGHNAFVVRDLLGHKTLAMTSRYVGTDIDPLRAVATTVANRIAAALDGGAVDASPATMTIAPPMFTAYPRRSRRQGARRTGTE